MPTALPGREGAALERLRRTVREPAERSVRARRAAELIREAGGYRWVGVYEVAATEIAALAWTGSEAPAFPRFPVDRGLNGAAVRSAQPVVVQDVRRDPRCLTTFGSTRAEAVFPVMRGSTSQVLGTIDVESDRLDVFEPADCAFLLACSEILASRWEG